jgi:enamine deaminase RidA (YjgF/YER057c/UK114 family)
MPIAHDPPGLFPTYQGYVHAMEVPAGTRLLFISGLNGFEGDGVSMPESFEEQAELVWTHIESILASAGMDVTHLVSLRTYLADPKYDAENARLRAKRLGGHRVSSTVVCCRLLDPGWKVEIEAIAAA